MLLGIDSKEIKSYIEVPKDSTNGDYIVYTKGRYLNSIYLDKNVNIEYHPDDIVEQIKQFKKSHSYNETMREFNISSKGTLWYILNKRAIY